MSLKAIQDNFQQYLLDGDDTFASDVVNDSIVGRKTRMGVYFNAYRGRLYDVLSEDYPKTFAIMGEDNFAKAFILYLSDNPSRHFSIRYFGKDFFEFLRHKPFNKYPYYAQMAEFEWKLGETLDAGDTKPYSIEEFSQLDAESIANLRLSFHDSVRFAALDYNIAELWLEYEQNEKFGEIKKYDNTVNWLLWRKDIKSYFESCTDDTWIIAKCIRNNYNFSEICEECANFVPEDSVALLVVQTMQKWLSQGLLANASNS